ncbi:hypothetical protein PPACK8108_LOCUS1965, partial [Phakopsora pachyrhizi]
DQQENIKAKKKKKETRQKKKAKSILLFKENLQLFFYPVNHPIQTPHSFPPPKFHTNHLTVQWHGSTTHPSPDPSGQTHYTCDWKPLLPSHPHALPRVCGCSPIISWLFPYHFQTSRHPQRDDQKSRALVQGQGRAYIETRDQLQFQDGVQVG